MSEALPDERLAEIRSNHKTATENLGCRPINHSPAEIDIAALLDELDRLRDENAELQQRLARYEQRGGHAGLADEGSAL